MWMGRNIGPSTTALIFNRIGVFMKAKFIVIQHQFTGNEVEGDIVPVQVAVLDTQFEDFESMAQNYENTSKVVSKTDFDFKDLNRIYKYYFRFPLKKINDSPLKGFLGETIIKPSNQKLTNYGDKKRRTTKDTYRIIVVAYNLKKESLTGAYPASG